MQKLLVPVLWVAAALVAWFYLAPETVPTQVSPQAVDAGHRAGQTVVDTGQHFYDSPEFWPYAISAGLAAILIMFWRNIGNKAKMIVVGLVCITGTMLVIRAGHK